ncbi:mitochondrial import inner membrane translocase subunit Tim23-like [Adelges cooleyi]|uniref:mitochondrial import inner membrane translocase subunit Tim23-like n=1 Tax=Adelges cooleyi TaxID=133065 RepID=UPI00217F4116|nr:mitochondrial import inner membrane translocase subunit Tim23-like [Adelges cooleyi]
MFSEESGDNTNQRQMNGFSIPSPYLNFDPTLLPQSTQPEYLYLEGGSKQRGQFELAFNQIGSSCLAGAALGSIRGLYNGIKMTSMENQTSTYNRTQILNSIFKNGAGLANSFGTISIYYSIFGIILEKTRGCDDELNTIVSGTSTGFLYKCTSGIKRCGIGGLIGFGLATTYCLVNSRDKIVKRVKEIYH